MKITELDKNFDAGKTSVDVRRFDIRSGNFSLHGLFVGENGYVRLPEDVVKCFSPALSSLSYDTSGGRIRFITDSPFLTLYSEMPKFYFPQMAEIASGGFDVYVEEDGKKYTRIFSIPYEERTSGGYESVVRFDGIKRRRCTLFFPLYNKVRRLEIGAAKDAYIEPAPYTDPRPVVFYGSSVTQGACAGRPSSCFPALLSKKLGFDYFNLGFSGNAKGERALAEYIGSMKVRALVCEYDHNAESADELERTHGVFFRRIREMRPDLPVVLISRFDFRKTAEDERRREIVRSTWRTAKENGDGHVYFLDGESVFASVGRDNCTTDGTHPNDLGMYLIACAIEKILKGAGISDKS